MREAADRKAMWDREEERKRLIAESGNNPMSKNYIRDFYRYMINETPKQTIETPTLGTRQSTNKYPARNTSPFRKGGKTRKQRGSRKSKKSRRR